MDRKPSIFIGSSSEGLPVAHQLQVALGAALPCEVTVWDQGIFGASTYTMEALVDVTRASDFAVLVTTPDDTTESRGLSNSSPRDNVLFELGLFMGALGVQRVFILGPSTPPVRLPSDLSGLTRLPAYEPRSDGNLHAALMPAVLAARTAINLRGPRGAPSSPSDAQGPMRAAITDPVHALATELERICSDAIAQGWRVRRSETALRLTSAKKRRHTFPISEDAVAARSELRRFTNELRADGLRVTRRVRRPVRSTPRPQRP